MKRKVSEAEKQKRFFLATFETKSVTEKGFDPNEPMIISGIANAGAEDRVGDIIRPEAWNIENFKKNPIILFNHDYSMPVGRGTAVGIEDGGLKITAEIGNPGAGYPLTQCQMEVRSLLAQGVLKAFSVGFWPIDGEWDDEKGCFIWTEIELLEISIVPVPCQQDSLVETVKALPNKREKAMDEELKKMLTEINDGVKACRSKLEEMGGKDSNDSPSPVEESLKAELAKALQGKKELEDENAQLKQVLDRFVAASK